MDGHLAVTVWHCFHGDSLIHVYVNGRTPGCHCVALTVLGGTIVCLALQITTLIVLLARLVNIIHLQHVMSGQISLTIYVHGGCKSQRVITTTTIYHNFMSEYIGGYLIQLLSGLRKTRKLHV